MTVLSRIIEPSEAVPVFTVPTGVPSKAASTPAVAEFACVAWPFRFRPPGLRRCGSADEGVASNSSAAIRQKPAFMTRVTPPEFCLTVLKREKNGVQHQ